MHCLWDATIAGSKEVQCVNSDVNVVRLHKEGKSTQWPVITWISAHDLKMCHGKGIGYRRGAQGVVGDPQHLLSEGGKSVQIRRIESKVGPSGLISRAMQKHMRPRFRLGISRGSSVPLIHSQTWGRTLDPSKREVLGRLPSQRSTHNHTQRIQRGRSRVAN